MGRHQLNPIRKYFTFEPATNKSRCQILGCEAKIAGNHGGNLQRHIEKRHPSTFRQIQHGLRTSAGDGDPRGGGDPSTFRQIQHGLRTSAGDGDPSTFRQIQQQQQHGLGRPAGDGGQTFHSVEEAEEEEEEGAYEYDSASADIFSHYRPITPPDVTEQAISFRLKGENDEDLLSNDTPRALKHDVVLTRFTDIMLSDMQQIQDPLLLMKLRRDITDLVFKAVEEDAKRSQTGKRKELYCQMSSEPCSSGGGPSSYLKNSRKQRRANRSQRTSTGGGGGGRGGAAVEEWRESMCELNSSVTLQIHQIKTETETEEMPVFFPPINLEGDNKG